MLSVPGYWSALRPRRRTAMVAAYGAARNKRIYQAGARLRGTIGLVRPRMPQVTAKEFEQLPLRVHTLMAGVALHDVWSVDLPRWRAGITLDDFLRTANNCLFTPSSLVRMLL